MTADGRAEPLLMDEICNPSPDFARSGLTFSPTASARRRVFKVATAAL
jgi:hypothetical protein